MPLRPFAFALGLACCATGAVVCATEAPDEVSGFPSLADGLNLAGLALVVVGVAGRAPRGRQVLRRPEPKPAPSDAEPSSSE